MFDAFISNNYPICSFVFCILYRLPYRLLYKLKFTCTFLVTLWTTWTVQRIQTSRDIMAHIKYLLAPYIINPAAAYFITILTPRCQTIMRVLLAVVRTQSDSLFGDSGSIKSQPVGWLSQCSRRDKELKLIITTEKTEKGKDRRSISFSSKL